MGNRIDDLEKNIADLMTQAGVDDKWASLHSAQEWYTDINLFLLKHSPSFNFMCDYHIVHLG